LNNLYKVLIFRVDDRSEIQDGRHHNTLYKIEPVENMRKTHSRMKPNNTYDE